MINVTSKALINLCNTYQTKDSDLTFLGGGREDSDGIAYSYYLAGHKKVLKILAVDKPGRDELQALNDRLAFVHYLGTQGINIAYPEENSEKNLYATYEDGDHIYIAYSMKYCEGENPKTELLTSDLSYHWGKLIGKSHRITKNYPIWKNINGKSSEYGYTDEINFFYDWCKDEFVKSKWQEMSVALSQLPISRNNHGFIHNDNHQFNIIINGNDITLIDFDVAGCHFFLQDIVVPVQGIMFDLAGGIFNNVYNKEPIQRYFNEFINGYETENHIEDFWLKQIDTFINYRRMLLFTCMQGYLNQNTELKNGFLSMIKEAPDIVRSLL
jgi:Ser/Thr protein kinase RdoA (MazF antagonist)